MSDTISTPHQATYQPAPASPKRSKVAIAVVGVLALAVGVLGWVAVSQHGKAVDAREYGAAVTVQRDDARADLADTQDDLADTEDDLSATQASLDDAETKLGSCGLVTELSSIQWDEANGLLDVADFMTDFKFTQASDKLDDVDAIVDDEIALINDNGFETVNDLWAACSPTASNS